MLAADVAPTRLEQAKRKLLDLLERRRDVQTAVVVFAGSAHTLVPLSDDLATTRNLLAAVHPALMPEPGQRADRRCQGLELLRQTGLGRGRLLLIGSSLDQHERSAIATLLQGQGERLLMLGVGTEQGAPIAGENGSFLKDTNGAILIPRLDNAGLQRFATELGGRYRQARLGDEDLAALGLLDQAGTLQRDDEVTRPGPGSTKAIGCCCPCSCWPRWLAVAAGCSVCHCCCCSHNRPAHSNSKTSGCAATSKANACWRRNNRRRPPSALPTGAGRRWRCMRPVTTPVPPNASPKAVRLPTTTIVATPWRDEALEAAIEAYEQALELQPDLQAAQRNKALVEELLRRRQEQSEPEPEQQEQEQTEPDEPQPQSQPPESGSASSPSTEDAQGEPASEASGAPQASTSEATDETGESSAQAQHEGLPDLERQQATEQWLRQIPDDPGELLRRKFLYEQRKRQGTNR